MVTVSNNFYTHVGTAASPKMLMRIFITPSTLKLFRVACGQKEKG
jgi:hypothetical protein